MKTERKIIYNERTLLSIFIQRELEEYLSELGVEC